MAQRVDPKYAIPLASPLEVSRTHLLERLEAAGDKSLLLIVASAGYGKSTLLAQYARCVNRSVAWVNLTSDDSEALVLGRSVAKAVTAALPGSRLASWERAVVLDAHPGQLANALASDLNLLEQDLLIVLEELEHLSEESGRWLTAFLRRLGEGHQVAATYWGGDIAVDFSRFIASGMTLILAEEDLAFSLAETELFFQNAPFEVGAAEAWEAVKGWPAALGMLLHGAPLKVAPNDLVRGLLAHLPVATRALLPEAAVLHVWSIEGAETLQLTLPGSWLLDAKRAGLPLKAIGNGAYQPHKVLLDTLEEQLLINAERHADLHNRAAEAAETTGDLLTAITHYRVARRFERARRLLDDVLPRYQRRAEWTLIRKVLEPFPKESLSPYALTMLGLALVETRAPDAGLELFNDQARAGTATRTTYFGLSLLAYRHGEGQKALAHAEAGLALEGDQREYTELLRVKAIALVDQNRTEEALMVAEECVRRAERQGESGLLASVLAVYQFVLKNLGRINESLTVGRRAIDLALLRDAPKKAMSAVDTYASTLWVVGRARESLPYLERMLLNSEFDYPLAEPFMLYQRAMVYEQLGQFEDALRDYETSAALFLDFQIISRAVNALADAASMYACISQVKAGEEPLATARALVSPEDASGMAHIKRAEGELALFSDDLDTAKAAFEWNYSYAQQHDSKLELIIAHGHLLEIARRKRTLDGSQVAALVSNLDSFGYDWPLQRYAFTLAKFYQECVEQDWFAERFRPYVNLVYTNVTLAAKPRLKLNLLGGFEAHIDGKEVRLSSKPQEVLAYLAVHGRTRIDVIADAVWPEATLRSAKQTLAQHVRRLRETLSRYVDVPLDPLPTVEGTYGLSEAIEMTLDVEALSCAAGHASADVIVDAVRRYRGEFLPFHDSDWVLEARRYYEGLASSLALAVARQSREDVPDLAIEMYEKAIQIDPFLQIAYEELALLHERSRNYTPALVIRRRWEDIERSLS